MCDRCELPGSRLPAYGSYRYRGKTALVIGAGPAGMVAARYLAREGFTVQVTPLRRVWRHADKDCTEQVSEKRGDPQENPYPRTRSNLIGLRPCTVDAMLDVGIDFPEEGFKSGVHALHGATFSQETGDGVQCLDQVQATWRLD